MKENFEDKYSDALHLMLQLVLSVLKWHDAAWLKEAQPLIKLLIDILETCDEKLMILVVDVASVIFASSRVLLTQEQSSFVVNKVCAISC